MEAMALSAAKHSATVSGNMLCPTPAPSLQRMLTSTYPLQAISCLNAEIDLLQQCCYQWQISIKVMGYCP